MERLRTAEPVEYKLVDEEGNLDRPLRVDPWFARGLRLNDGRLELERGDWPGRTVRPKPPMLEEFARLGAPGRDHDQAVLTYARRWGLLDLCEHGLPMGHDEIDVPISFAVTGAVRVTFVPTKRCVSLIGREPVSAWLYWSRQAAAVLAIVSRLREDESARAKDWSTLGEEGPWVTSIEGVDGFRLRAQQWTQVLVQGYHSDESTDEAKTARREVERSVVLGAIKTWLQLGHAALELRWPLHRLPAVGFGVQGLFGSLGAQLLLAAADSSGFAICAGCGALLAPRRRPGRPTLYCADCKAEHKPQQLADERRLRKKAKAASGSPVGVLPAGALGAFEQS